MSALPAAAAWTSIASSPCSSALQLSRPTPLRQVLELASCLQHTTWVDVMTMAGSVDRASSLGRAPEVGCT
jgi:hypothetical protein